MAKCKNCINLYNLSDEDDVMVGKWCPKIVDCPDTEMERDCIFYKPMTNAYRIRAMTDGELAEFMEMVRDNSAHAFCLQINHGCWYECPKRHACKANTSAIYLDWLQEEMEE